MHKQFIRSPKMRALPKIVLVIVAAVGLFMMGLAVGQGRLHISGLSGSRYQSRTGLPKTLNFDDVNQVYQALRDNYDGALSQTQVLDGLKHGLAQSTKDPYTEYFTASESKEFNSDLQGEFTGIGAKLELDADGNVTVVAPLDGSPAEAAGVRAKDIIAAIDGKTTSGMTANEAVLKIRGAKGTKVKLTLIRDKKDQIDVTITRDTIKVPTATSKILDGNVGYLQVSQFSDDTDELSRKAAQQFRDAGVQKVVLDLRDNPGGEVTSAVGLCSLWLDNGAVVVQQKRGSQVIDTSRATGEPLFSGMKTVVLVNAGSASASEITALALRDQAKATIIGQKSYGKGVVQQLVPFSDGSSLKVTIAKWYSPKGTNIDKKGITPDREVTMSDDDYKTGNDPQLQAAQAFLNQ